MEVVLHSDGALLERLQEAFPDVPMRHGRRHGMAILATAPSGKVWELEHSGKVTFESASKEIQEVRDSLPRLDEIMEEHYDTEVRSEPAAKLHVPAEEEVSVEDDEGLTLHGSGALLEQASAATQLQPSDTDAPCVYALSGSDEFFGPWDPVSVDAFVRHRKRPPLRIALYCNGASTRARRWQEVVRFPFLEEPPLVVQQEVPYPLLSVHTHDACETLVLSPGTKVSAVRDWLFQTLRLLRAL